MGDNRIILGTRGSRLALAQADMVRQALESRNAGLELEIKVITTTGDRRTDIPLSQVARESGVFDKGVFLKELEQALADGSIDMAVHSLKDMPSDLPVEFELSAVLRRAAVEDVLVSKKEDSTLLRRVATSSVRRRCMVRQYFGEEVEVVDIRGNVNTRLGKLAGDPDLDGIILARAGLDRLGMRDRVLSQDGIDLFVHGLPLSSFVPCAGQGIIGIEIRKGDTRMKQLTETVNDAPTMVCARAEREFLRLLGADCSTPVGVYAQLDEITSRLKLNVMLFTDGCEGPQVLSQEGPACKPEELASSLIVDLKGG